MTTMKAVITVTGKDTVGIIADVAGVCAKHGANILDITQSVLSEYFAMIMLAEIDKLTDECDRECQALIIRARSSAAMAKRNAILEARAKLIDDAYSAAEKQIKSMNGEQYLELLCKTCHDE